MKTALGVDVHYVSKNLSRILRDFTSTPADELARALLRVAHTVDAEASVATAKQSAVRVTTGTGWIKQVLEEKQPTLATVSAKQLAEDLTLYALAADFTVSQEEEFKLSESAA